MKSEGGCALSVGGLSVNSAGGCVPLRMGHSTTQGQDRAAEPRSLTMTVTAAGISLASSQCCVLVEMPDILGGGGYFFFFFGTLWVGSCGANRAQW